VILAYDSCDSSETYARIKWQNHLLMMDAAILNANEFMKSYWFMIVAYKHIWFYEFVRVENCQIHHFVYVWHVTLEFVSWLIILVCVWELSKLVCVPWRSHMWTWRIRICDMTHLCVGHDSVMCVTLTRLYVAHTVCVCVTHRCDMTHLY